MTGTTPYLFLNLSRNQKIRESKAGFITKVIVKKRHNKKQNCKQLHIRLLANSTESRRARPCYSTREACLLYEEQGFARRGSVSYSEKLTMRQKINMR